MRQQILSGDGDYKMPSNKPLTRVSQERAAGLRQAGSPAQHVCRPAKPKQTNICSLADTTERKHTCNLKDWCSQRSQKGSTVSSFLQSLQGKSTLFISATRYLGKKMNTVHVYQLWMKPPLHFKALRWIAYLIINPHNVPFRNGQLRKTRSYFKRFNLQDPAGSSSA